MLFFLQKSKKPQGIFPPLSVAIQFHRLPMYYKGKMPFTQPLGTFFRSIRFNIVQWRANQAELPSPWCAFSRGKMRVGRIWQLTVSHNFSHHDTGLFQTHNFFHWQIRVKWILKMHVSIFKSLYIFWGNFTFLRSKTAPITNPLYKTWWPF